MGIINNIVIIPVWLLKDIEISEEMHHILGGLLFFAFIYMAIKLPYMLLRK